jgi:cobalt-zinc-cadmium resistance protein CzcA
MIERVLDASFRRPALCLLLVLAAAAFGAASFARLPRDVFPDLSAPVFNVIVQNAAMGPEELEIGVAVPTETALAGLPDVRRIRSASQLGVAQITVEFEPDADYFRSRQLVAERVAQAAPQYPPGTEPPLLSSLTGRLNEIFEFTLEAEPGAIDLMTLRDLAEFELRGRLLAVPGVSAVETLGGYLRQLQVQLDPARMAARDVTLDLVLAAVEESNASAAGGFVVRGPMEWTIRALGRVRTPADLRETVVAVRGGSPVLVGDVAEVREAPAVRRGMAHRLRGEVVSARISKQFGADTVETAARIRAALDAARGALPKGVELRTVYDQSELVGDAIGGVARAVLLGAALVVGVLLLLLGNVRAAALVTLTLPLSIALAGVVLPALGVGLNTMTLGGLAIAVGLLVDAAIILTENVLHRLAAPGEIRPVRDVARAAAREVGRPIAFATFIVLAVFTPLFGMSGIEGRMYRPLAAAVVASMAAALALSLTAVPVAAAVWLRAPRTEAEVETRAVRWLKRVYAPLLDACLRRAARVRAATAAATIAALALGTTIGRDFIPPMDEGALLIQTMLPAEASLDEVDRLNHRAEDVLREIPEVVDVVRRTGRAERTEDPMPHTVSDVLVLLAKDRHRTLDAIEDDIRARLAGVPALSALVTTPLGMRIDEGLGGTPADLSVRVFGPDLAKLAELAQTVRAAMSGIAGIADLRADRASGLPQLRVEVDRAAAARLGLAPGDIVRAVRIGLAGEEVGEVWRDQRRFDVVVRLQDDRRDDARAIAALPIDAHGGVRVPLGQVASILEVEAPAAIRRESGMRRVAVEAGVAGRDLGSTAAEVRETLARTLDLPQGYFVDVGGRIESQERAARSLGVAIAVALFAVFVLLYLALGSFAEVGLIMATLPTALVGGILALLVTGGTWNVSSLVGLIGLFGIAVQNALVLVAQVRGFHAGGRPYAEAVREASLGRVRPKILTAATAILGLLPILVLRLHGTEIERPLAVVMTGGLVTSTLFTLLALPAFLLWLEARGSARRTTSP